MRILSLALLSLAGTAMAADTNSGYWDLRLGLFGYPGLDKAEYTQNGNTWTDSNWETSTGGMDIGASHRFDAATMHSGYLTFGMSFRGTSGNDKGYATTTDISIGAFALYFGGGYSLRPNDVYSLEIGPRIALGGATAEEKVPGWSVTSDSGSYTAFDLSATNMFNIGERFQLGVALGIAAWQANVSYPSTAISASGDAKYSGSGAYLAFLLGVRI